MLRVIARCDPSIPTVNPDGIFGRQTEKAVKAFQRKHGLPQTGAVDYETWCAIRKAYANDVVEVSEAQPLQIEMDAELLPGSDNRNVLLIQAMLYNLHEIYANLPACSLSGSLDEETVCAVRSLQEICGMQCTGIVDKNLWKQLACLYHQAVGDGNRTTVCSEKIKTALESD